MDLEEKLKLEFGTKRYFKVPETYFDTFTDKMMAILPEKPPTMSIWHRDGSVVTAAACFIGLVCLSSYLYVFPSEEHNNSVSFMFQPHIYDKQTTIDQMTDYMMIDSDEMYAYLADY